MSKPVYRRPIGEIYYVLNNEAICRPLSSFKGRGWQVFVDELLIGILGDPFGNIERPFQPILINKNIDTSDLIGKNAFVSKRKKKKKRNYRNKSKNRINKSLSSSKFRK